MKPKMIYSIFKHHKIFNSVIISDFVNMMYDFFLSKIPFKIFFYYKTLFSNISVNISERMSGLMNKNIAICSIFKFTTVPMIGIFTRKMRI